MTCHWAPNSVGTWFYGEMYNGVWYNCDKFDYYFQTGITIASGIVAIPSAGLLGFLLYNGIQAYRYSRPQRTRPAEIYADDMHSAINVADIIQQKMAPPPTSTVPPPVQQMTYTFGDPLHDDDHTVRLYLALSQEEAAIVKKRA